MNLQDIELGFDRFMLKIGFSRVVNDVGDSPKFENADYVQKFEKKIVELKIISSDFLENGGFIDSLHAFVTRPKEINDTGFGLYEFKFPNINREGTLDNFEEPLRRILKKANRQIRETKNYYFPDDMKAYGFVIIALIGLNSVPPILATQVIAKILNNEFKNIDGAIVCKPFESIIENTSLVRKTECHSITNEFDQNKKMACMKIADEWIDYLDSGDHQKNFR